MQPFAKLKVCALVLALAASITMWAGPNADAALQSCASIPENDDKACAIVLPGSQNNLPVTVFGHNVGATPENNEMYSSCSSFQGDSVWWQFSPDFSGSIVVETLGSDFDTILSVWDDFGNAVGCNDQVFDTDQSQLGFSAVAGNTYWIQVESWSGVAGNITLTLSERFAPCQDDFACALPLGPVPAVWAQWNDLATVEVGEPGPSCSPNGPQATLWYSFTPSETANFWVDGYGEWNSMPAVVSIWSGTNLSNLIELGCSVSGDQQPPVAVALEAGTTYFIQADTPYLPDRLVVWVNKACGEFDDVPDAAYFTTPVRWAACSGVTTGTSPTTFSPHSSVTRAQMATFLWRFAGQPTGWNHAFTDVPPGSYYDEAVAWMSATGVTTGTSPTTYSPHSTLTRAQAVTFLYRYAFGAALVPEDHTYTSPELTTALAAVASNPSPDR